MSLSVNGVWKTGVWSQTVWADGVWREDAYLKESISFILSICRAKNFTLAIKRNISHNLKIIRELEL